MKQKSNSNSFHESINAADHFKSNSRTLPPTFSLSSNNIQLKGNEDKAVQRKTAPFQLKGMEEEEEQIQRKSSVRKVEQSEQSANRSSMPEAVQAKMESSFNTDFSNVNIYNNSQKAVGLGAHAFAQGNQVHFAPGKYNPTSQSGQKLLGHELTHVVQQRQGRVSPTTQLKDAKINDDVSLEKEADDLGAKAAEGKEAPLKHSNTRSIDSNSAPIQGFGFGDATDWLKEKGSTVTDIASGGVNQVADKTTGIIGKTTGWLADKKDTITDTIGNKAGDLISVVPAITTYVKRAASAVEKIISNPIGFLRNLLNAVKNGIGLFFGNITKHIRTGLTDWLFSVLGDVGIRFPESFSLSAMFSLTKQIIRKIWSVLRRKIMSRIPDVIIRYGQKAGDLVTRVIDVAPEAILRSLKRWATSLSKRVKNAKS